jgi:hypothetical protein
MNDVLAGGRSPRVSTDLAQGTWPSRRWCAIYAGIALALTAVEARMIQWGAHHADRAVRHAQILGGAGESPWVYRVLSPQLAEATRGLLHRVTPTVDALEWSYAGWYALWLVAFFVLFHRWLSLWAGPAGARWPVVGVGLAAALHLCTYRFYWFSPDAPLDLVGWVGAAWLGGAAPAIRDRWLVPWIFFGALNRETAVFAAILAGVRAFDALPARAAMGRLMAWIAAFLVPYTAIRYGIGSRPAAVHPWGALRANLDPDWAVPAALFTLPWLGAAAWALRNPSVPRVLRWSFVAVVSAYVPLVLLFGRVRELRLWLPLLIVAVPLLPFARRRSA